jgi:hypothetical protein
VISERIVGAGSAGEDVSGEVELLRYDTIIDDWRYLVGNTAWSEQGSSSG